MRNALKSIKLDWFALEYCFGRLINDFDAIALFYVYNFYIIDKDFVVIDFFFRGVRQFPGH